MDEIDKSILKKLGINARMTASRIGRDIKLSVPAVTERIRKLEDHGTIRKYAAVMDRKEIGMNLLSFIAVVLEKTKHIENFRTAIADMDEVVECHHIAGEYDYMLKVAVDGTTELEAFIMDKLKAIPGVEESKTFIVFSSLKENVNGGEYS